MFKYGQKPSAAIIDEARRLWGKDVNKLTWEEIKLGAKKIIDGGIKTFHCPHEDVCEIIELHSFKDEENGSHVLYGIGRCLSCAKIYWGKIDQD